MARQAQWMFTSTELGLPPVGSFTLTTPAVAPGSVRHARDISGSYGGAEFVYLQGIASTVEGDMVYYTEGSWTGNRLGTGANKRGACAVAMSANVAASYDWYQISGVATVNVNSAALSSSVYATGTAGRVDAAVLSAAKLDGAFFASAIGTYVVSSQALVMLSRPAANGNALVI